MGNFDTVKDALEYIDNDLGQALNLDGVAEKFHFSPYYFHRMFAQIVGKPFAVYVRERRLLRACEMLHDTHMSVLDIAVGCGYNSAQSFSRAFKSALKLTPLEYRRKDVRTDAPTVDELIMKFTNRLKGGVVLKPKIIKHGALRIAGVSGDGDKTWDVWSAFEKLKSEKPPAGKLSENGYEIRIYDNGKSTVHVGYAVSDGEIEAGYEVLELPASWYASFDVYVANGYDSENNAMNEWLAGNEHGYTERLLGAAHYCVEYYDERFNGSEAGSIVEIWVPVTKPSAS